MLLSLGAMGTEEPASSTVEQATMMMKTTVWWQQVCRYTAVCKHIKHIRHTAKLLAPECPLKHNCLTRHTDTVCKNIFSANGQLVADYTCSIYRMTSRQAFAR